MSRFQFFDGQTNRVRELYQWLAERNGLFAFASALHVSQKGRAESPTSRIYVALLVAFLLVSPGCKVAQEDQGNAILPEARSAEPLIIEHLSKLYEQPANNLWEEGKTYFLPEDSGIELLQEIQPGAGLKRLRVYRANLWLLHWGPERFPILVWAVESEGKPQPQLGVLAGSDEVVSEFPTALKSLHFKSQETRENLALLVGKMLTVFHGESSPGGLQVVSEGNCEWIEQLGDARRRVGASCFSKDGVLERIVLGEPNT